MLEHYGVIIGVPRLTYQIYISFLYLIFALQLTLSKFRLFVRSSVAPNQVIWYNTIAIGEYLTPHIRINTAKNIRNYVFLRNSRTGDTLKTYEITYLTSNEETIDAKTVSEVFSKNGVIIVSVHPWGGRRKLAYPIKKQDQAFFTTVVFDAEQSAIAPIEKALQLNNDILRTIIVDFVPGVFHRTAQNDDNNARPTEKPKPEAPTIELPAEAIEEIKETPILENEPVQKADAVADETEVKPVKPKRTTKKTTPEAAKELDEKLDALLKEDITK
jgi:small subunit ribosomal protein S6